jgi:NAD(P)H-flavin reductase
MHEESGMLRFTDVMASGHTGGDIRKSDLGRYELTHRAEITNVYPLTPDTNLYQVQIVDPLERKRFTFEPGQFIMLEVPGIGEAPFSISSSPVRHGNIELCIRSAGNLTGFLSRARRGIRVGIRGPFGRGFPMGQMTGHDILLIAGGLGLAPLRAPLEHVLENRSRFADIHVLYGARTPSDLLFTYQYESWRKFDIDLRVIVERPDRSWKGPSGLITKALEELCSGPDRCLRDSYAIVCGPPVMFKYVCEMLTASGIPMMNMFVSLERRMHCGMGKCCRCNVGSTYTCMEGPVFDYWSVMNLKEAI